MSVATGAVTVPAFDALPEADARELLTSCCGARAWVDGMLERRPFGSLERVLAAADDVWWALAPSDWLEAFRHHPRIGERAAAAAQGERARGWSGEEQRATSEAREDVRTALAAGNREYERRFGHIYLVCATGKSADEMLKILQRRLTNDSDTELRGAAAEQAKITRLRLLKLLGPAPHASTS